MSVSVSTIDVKAIDERVPFIILAPIERENFYWYIERLELLVGSIITKGSRQARTQKKCYWCRGQLL